MADKKSSDPKAEARAEQAVEELSEEEVERLPSGGIRAFYVDDFGTKADLKDGAAPGLQPKAPGTPDLGSAPLGGAVKR